MTGRKIYIREFSGWLVANLILPLIAPFIIVLLCEFIAAFVGKVDTSILGNMYNALLDKGVYAFLCISILLSLFQDYKIANKVITFPLAIAWTLLLLLLGLLFINSLGLIIGDTTISEFAKRIWFIRVSVFSIVFATILKLEIIYYKIKELYKLD
jgi:uncharacterized membrane protein YjjP (DUF1212 family)